MSHINLKINDKIAELELDNIKKLNSLTVKMLQQLEDHCTTLDLDNKVKVVILSSKGEQAFCVGADIKAWSELSPVEFARNWVRNGHRVFDRLAGLSKPTIAVINGHAFGGGLELAASCDLRVMSPDALLALPESSIGIVPGWSGTQRLQRLLPEPVIKEMAMFGRRISADRAHTLGFVAEVAEDPLKEALKIANSFLPLSSTATEVTKCMIHAGAGENVASLIEALGSGMMSSNIDKSEGVAAFLEKRQPNFE